MADKDDHPMEQGYRDTAIYVMSRRKQSDSVVQESYIAASLGSATRVYDKVLAFHILNQQPHPLSFVPMNEARIKMRIGLCLEETLELINAAGFELWYDYGGPNERRVDSASLTLVHRKGAKPDYIEILDALGDSTYVNYGFAVELGCRLDKAIEEIHASNLTKLGENGKPIYRLDGKILKGPGYRKPNLRFWFPQVAAYMDDESVNHKQKELGI